MNADSYLKARNDEMWFKFTENEFRFMLMMHVEISQDRQNSKNLKY